MSATARTWCRCGFPICRLLLSSFCRGLIGRSCGFPVGFSAGVSRLLTGAFDSFLCLSRDRLSRLFCFLSYGLGSLFCFLADRFSSVFCFLTYCFQSVLDCFPCLFRDVLYVLNYALLTKRSHRCGRNQSSNQTRDFHIPFLLLIYVLHYWFGSGRVVARTGNRRRVRLASIDFRAP